MAIEGMERARLRARLREVYKQLEIDPKNKALIAEHNEIVDKLITEKLMETNGRWREQAEFWAEERG